MVINPVRSILRAATRSPEEPLNILCAPTHERFETGLAKTGHRFWAIRCPQVKGWNQVYAPVPSNYVLLNPERGENQIPPEVSFDLVLSQNKFGQYNILSEFAKQLHVPLISLEHTLPVPTWPGRALEQLKAMKGHVNVFISEFSRKAWGWAMSARVHISLFNLIVEVESDFKYPDQMQDMSNRAMSLFQGAIEFCKANNLDIRTQDVDDFIDEDDD